jgi:GNAT superfamily N-acetyltransferase
LNKKDGVYELGKMAITSLHQGKGLSNLLMQHCINKALELKAKKVILYSNRRLLPALQLYRKFGFKEVPLEDSKYERSDIKMEKTLI